MECSNCGKEIPFFGKVCPYCNADKSEDKETTISMFVALVPAAFAAFAAGAEYSSWGAAIVAFLAAFILVMVLLAKLLP